MESINGVYKVVANDDERYSIWPANQNNPSEWHAGYQGAKEEARLGPIIEAICNGATSDELASLVLPESYRAVCVRQEDTGMFDGIPVEQRDPSKSLRVQAVPVPPLSHDEALVAVMASSINFNTVWSAIFHPVPTFTFLRRLSRDKGWGPRHLLPYHVIGADAAGVVLRTGAAVHRWRPGDRVVVHSVAVDSEDPDAHDDAMLAGSQRAWGYETNFGGLAELTIVKASQLMPKPRHLTWEEAACNPACAATAYRMIVSPNGANMKQGDVVLIWGAAGGIGGYAVQFVLNGGGIPVGVVSSAEKAALMHAMGCEAVIDRKAASYSFWRDEMTVDEDECRRFRSDIRKLVGEDPDIVFEHPGRATLAASVYTAKRGGTIITCAASSGYMVTYDNRHLWMRLKSLKSSHSANYREGWATNRLVERGRIQPILSAVYSLADTPVAAARMHRNLHHGKLGVLCLAPREGLGVQDPERRAQIGDSTLTRFRRPQEICR